MAFKGSFAFENSMHIILVINDEQSILSIAGNIDLIIYEIIVRDPLIMLVKQTTHISTLILSS